uniref:Uncharacterized protein n=1 Tax=Timema douglasi TaxID=61478 RepID=A0A7R8VM86_TIMDO|nr:unnamed protein product [Timema douglasi]
MEGQDVCARKAKPVKPLAITSIFNTLSPLDGVDAKRVIVSMSVKNNSTPYRKQDARLKRVAYLAPSWARLCDVWDLINVAVNRWDMWSTPVARDCNDLIDTLVVDVCDTLTKSSDVIDLEQPTVETHIRNPGSYQVNDLAHSSKVTIYSSCRPAKLVPGKTHCDIIQGYDLFLSRLVLSSRQMGARENPLRHHSRSRSILVLTCLGAGLEVLVFCSLLVVFLLAGCTVSLCRSKITRDLLSAAVTTSQPHHSTLTIQTPAQIMGPTPAPVVPEPPPPPYHIAVLLPHQNNAQQSTDDSPPPSYREGNQLVLWVATLSK